ncbi:hypothetical protein KVV02_008139 [Mortierella alpina]|uniref:NTF2-domain-containing protein n=1 Tax=Mortierella alpina TaxID=64518 RepID=A0A9P7ZYS7_MORAP|nr:hypothetical protein KVV02_008139 [Mortierella alpina]
MTAPTATSPTVNGAESQPPVDADSVGSQFAHEYYTFLNKEPTRLHLFYNKNSVMSHGYQGKDVDVCRGQQASTCAIREKVVQLDFEDCKVLVQNIDSQNSLNGGIVIQVLGQMSNRGGIAQQFVQTFFLAEQPKGYYVLNDVFRFLKDDTVEDDEQDIAEEASTEHSAEQPVTITETKSETTPAEAVSTPAPTIAQAPTMVEIQEEQQAPTPVTSAAVDEKKTADKKADKKGDRKSEAKETKKPEAKKEAEPVDSVPVPAKADVPSAPTAAPVAATAPVEAIPAPSVPAGPPKPKTWANLAAGNSNQWGVQASANKGASVPAPQPAAPKAQIKPHTAGQSQGQGQQVKTPGTRANGREEYHSIYIKNVTERMSLDMLRESFSKFGKVTHLEYTHKRNCAFLDFSTPDAMNAALKQNTVPVGNEIVLAEERRRGSNNSFNNSNTHPNGPQTGGRFHNNASNSNTNGHGQQTQGGHRGARPNNARGGPGGPSDRAKQPQHKQEKAAQPTIVK